MNNQTSTSGVESKAAFGLAGASGGTILVLIANNLSPENPYKPFLLLASPALSIFLSGLLLWAQAKFINYLREREVKVLTDKIRKQLEEIINNPENPDKRKAMARRKLNELDELTISGFFERLKAIKFVTEENVGEIERVL